MLALDTTSVTKCFPCNNTHEVEPRRSASDACDVGVSGVRTHIFADSHPQPFKGLQKVKDCACGLTTEPQSTVCFCCAVSKSLISSTCCFNSFASARHNEQGHNPLQCIIIIIIIINEKINVAFSRRTARTKKHKPRKRRVARYLWLTLYKQLVVFAVNLQRSLYHFLALLFCRTTTRPI